MKATLSLLVVLASVASACKCVGYLDKKPDTKLTRDCCNFLHKNYDGDDCPANRISNVMYDFETCCWSLGLNQYLSDCKSKHRRHPKDLQQ